MRVRVVDVKDVEPDLVRQQRDLATLTYPTRRSFEDLERFTRKRPAYDRVEIGVEAPGRPLRPDPLFGVIDYERWDELWRRH